MNLKTSCWTTWWKRHFCTWGLLCHPIILSFVRQGSHLLKIFLKVTVSLWALEACGPNRMSQTMCLSQKMARCPSLPIIDALNQSMPGPLHIENASHLNTIFELRFCCFSWRRTSSLWNGGSTSCPVPIPGAVGLRNSGALSLTSPTTSWDRTAWSKTSASCTPTAWPSKIWDGITGSLHPTSTTLVTVWETALVSCITATIRPTTQSCKLSSASLAWQIFRCPLVFLINTNLSACWWWRGMVT